MTGRVGDRCRMCGVEHTEPPCAYGPPKPMTGLAFLLRPDWRETDWTWNVGNDASPITAEKLEAALVSYENFVYRPRPRVGKFTAVDTA